MHGTHLKNILEKKKPNRNENLRTGCFPTPGLIWWVWIISSFVVISSSSSLLLDGSLHQPSTLVDFFCFLVHLEGNRSRGDSEGAGWHAMQSKSNLRANLSGSLVQWHKARKKDLFCAARPAARSAVLKALCNVNPLQQASGIGPTSASRCWKDNRRVRNSHPSRILKRGFRSLFI